MSIHANAPHAIGHRPIRLAVGDLDRQPAMIARSAILHPVQCSLRRLLAEPERCKRMVELTDGLLRRLLLPYPGRYVSVVCERIVRAPDSACRRSPRARQKPRTAARASSIAATALRTRTRPSMIETSGILSPLQNGA